MTRLLLLSLAAALLAGILALPFTMPGGAFGRTPTAVGAADAGVAPSLRPAPA